jgi:MFS family permease
MPLTERQTPSTRLTFLLLAISISTYSMLQSFIAPVLPMLAVRLNAGQDTITWLMTAYLLSAAVFTPILGRVGDAMGKVRVLALALAAQAAGGVLAALVPALSAAIAGRAIQGLGAGVIPLGFGLVRDRFPATRVTPTIGLLSGLMAGASGLGLAIAGLIVDAFGYPWLFWIPSILSVAAAAGLLAFVRESPVRSPGRVNWIAAVVLSCWLVSLIVAVSRAQAWGWGSAPVTALLAAAAALLIAWIIIEARAREPLVDMRMMRLPAVWPANIAALLVGVVLFANFTFLPRYIQAPASSGYGFGASVAVAGLLLVPMQLAMFVLGAMSGRLSARFGSRWVLAAGAVAGVPGCLLMAATPTSYWLLILATILLGVGAGMAYSSMASIVVEAVPASQTGVATGMNTNIRTIGGSIGTAAMASIVTSRLLPGGLPEASGYTFSFAALAVIGLLALLAALAIPRPASPPADVAACPHAGLSPIVTATPATEGPGSQ